MADFLVLFYQSRQIIDVGEAKRSLRALFVLKIMKTCKKKRKKDFTIFISRSDQKLLA